MDKAGFTLIELLIAITIIGILTAIAIPSYQLYTRKAYYTEIIQAAAPYKLGVEECFQVTGGTKDCQAGINNIPQKIGTNNKTTMIDTIDVVDGKIMVTPREKHGIHPTDTYTLEPDTSNDQLTWKTAGGGKDAGYFK